MTTPVPYSGELHSQISDLLRDWSPADGPREQMADKITTHVIARVVVPMLEVKDDQIAQLRAELASLRRAL